MEKSTIYLAGTAVSAHPMIKDWFSFDVGQLPVWYLGLPLVTKCLTSVDYLPLIEQLKRRIASWTTHFLSFAGRLNRISSILWSVCNFWLAAFRLPQECIREIDKLCFASGYSEDFALGDSEDFASGDSEDFASGDSKDFASGDSEDFASGDSEDFASGRFGLYPEVKSEFRCLARSQEMGKTRPQQTMFANQNLVVGQHIFAQESKLLFDQRNNKPRVLDVEENLKIQNSSQAVLQEYLPEGNQATGSYYETETLMRKLGLPYHTYDVCIDNCMLFWKEDAKFGNCKFCGKPRYKESEGRTRIPFSKMWYLPIGDRLKRMYQSEKTAASMRWHAEHESEEGLMCHPSDAAEWKNFQQLHPSFAEEPRNVYLGLCTDRFNLFGMSKNHSLWPVILTPYNLPPDMCMNSEYLFLTILNSGPNHPRASLDVFLQPLIDELQDLWHNGVEAYDVSLDQNFNLKAVLLWTISDFPAYGMLSGWTTHGRLSCPICMEDTNAFWLPGESILWQLPYWVDLNLRHNLDVMHIEKNVLDNIIYTVMNVKDKSKDNVRSRIDVSRFCDRPELHVDDQGKAPFPIWRLSAKAKKSILEWVKSEVKFPDGYVADLASCADINAGKFSGMKSHDSHVFMERLLPFVFAELLPRNVHLALSGLGAFFRDLSTQSLELSRVQNLKENIVMILCNLEKIFPPSFFDVMEHLPVHLPDEAELGGPVQYRWMYPFERFFKRLKGKAKKKRYPAGSIVQSYMNDEISYFSEHYFASHISTAIRRRSSRYDAGDVLVYPIPVPDIFTQVGRPSGKSSEFWLTKIDYKCAHAYVLRNCDYFRPLESVLEAQIRYDSPELSDEEVLLKRDEDFPMWIRQYITLFYCEWYDPTVGKGVRIGNGGSQADQVCYLSYPYTKRPRKSWLTVCKVNPRNVIQGNFSDTDLVILQQTVDDATPTIVEEVIVDTLVDGNHQDEHIDFDIEDAEPEDEFLCNLSTSEDEDEEFEDE
ncbi:hypothetical protein ISN44_As13g008310 [Arabidopsis suecica]|uniref:DUF4218 domain-containing protein n=1 Tax=Arabidopsis suecica TaxID=45249 RepID=A0A8T1XS39_ARASU|nr:hypothetical protein ISN44_As13g008310 [Arabidopsis suecica]